MGGQNFFNGQKLKEARIFRGMSIAQLAEKANIKRQTISTYENRPDANPELKIITAISDILNFPRNYFYRKDEFPIYKTPTYFRSQLTAPIGYKNQQETKFSYIAKIYAFLSEYIEYPAYIFSQIKNNDDGTIDIEKTAQELRDTWGLGMRPIDNIVHLIEEKGIIAVKFSSETNSLDAYSKLMGLKNESRYLIGYTENKCSASRIHFDIAHELGHIIFHHELEEDIESVSKEEIMRREHEANDFASAFLLPKDTFIRTIGSGANILETYIAAKKIWKVSIAAMIRRARTLELISNDKYQYFVRIMQKRGIVKNEPFDNELFTLPPALLQEGVELLINQNIFTPTEMVNELFINYDLPLYSEDIEKLLNLKKGILDNKNESHKYHLRLVK